MVRGPKPNPDRQQVRDMRVTIRLSKVEYDYLHALAMKQGKSVGELMRLLALAGRSALTKTLPIH